MSRESDMELADYAEQVTLHEAMSVRPGPAAGKGRPSLSGRGETGHLSLRVPAAITRRYLKAAKRRGLTLSEVVRETLAEHAPRG